MMEGSISVESAEGKGSKFTVRVPQKSIGQGTLGKELARNLGQFRINSISQMKRAKITREYMPYGKVLIVDDVESNLYVARGFMAPYGLAIDTAGSGPEAIEKIKSGKEYDIVFMDHMMPKMDGIEAVRIIREMGYAEPIIALTANAVVGKSEMFLKNGFDSFISKPIDIRQLNEELNKFIRDKQPAEVLLKAKEQKIEFGNSVNAEPRIDSALLSIFLRDAKKFLPIFESTLKNITSATDSDLYLFSVSAHGIKSALANIGETAFAQMAFVLEKAGKERDKSTIATRTNGLIEAINVLVKKIEAKIKTDKKTAADKDSDPEFLREQLKIISAAAEIYDTRTANAALESLKKMSWTGETEEFIEQISEDVLLSNFDEIVEKIAIFA
jgi:CheY-like chemotaxis protein